MGNEPRSAAKSSMPLIDSITESCPFYEQVVALHINHDVANSYRFSEAMTKCFGAVVMVGCAYQNSAREDRSCFRGTHLHAVCREDGCFNIVINEEPSAIVCPGFVESVDMMITIAITKFCLPLIRNGKRLVIIEDGGYHSSVIDNLVEAFPELEQHIAGSVEQTTSGSKIISARESWRYPMISVSRSDIKMGFESIFIGQRIVEELSNFLYTAESFLNFSPILIIGYGIIGRSVAKSLMPYRCRIRVAEKDGNIRQTARREGYPISSLLNPADYRENMIIIGCVGEKTFGLTELEAYFAGDSNCIYLASASSKDIEFRDILKLLSGELRQSDYRSELIESGEYFKRYNISHGGKTKQICIIADGKPVNFCRKGGISLTDKVMDLVFSEMLICALALFRGEPLPNAVHVLGEEKSELILNEEELLKKWFAMNYAVMPAEPFPLLLDYHPDFDLLRKKIFEKNNINSLL